MATQIDNRNGDPSRSAGLMALVVGQGSIGQRHARILREDGFMVSAVSAHGEAFRSIDDAFAKHQFNYVVVANETSRHVGSVETLKRLGYRGMLLVEKPLSISPWKLSEVLPFERFGVAYNLRFHPVISALREVVGGVTPVDIRMHVGQYLPDWRPGSDHRTQSSALLAAGGGALRDLSHEIDLLNHLFGSWKRLVSIGGNRGVLGIETDEAWSILLELQSGATVTLSLNYFDRMVERHIVVNTANDTWKADLVRGRLMSKATDIEFAAERDQTYRAQHHAMRDPHNTTVCTLEEADGVTTTIAAIERSAREARWIEG